MIKKLGETNNCTIEIEKLLVDVSKEEDVDSMVKAIVKRWTRVDYVVNAAGTYDLYNDAPSSGCSTLRTDRLQLIAFTK